MEPRLEESSANAARCSARGTRRGKLGSPLLPLKVSREPRM